MSLTFPSKSGDPTGGYYTNVFDFTGGLSTAVTSNLNYPEYGFATEAISVEVKVYQPWYSKGVALGALNKAKATTRGSSTMVIYYLEETSNADRGEYV